MSFWQTSDNDNAANTGAEFETGGGNMEPIPAGTRLQAIIDDAKWDDFSGDEFISLRWSVLAPEEFKNRKVFQKVRVLDDDPKKSDKAKRMLAAIDHNCGGKLTQQEGRPGNQDLQIALMNKPMLIDVQVWEMQGSDGQMRSGNWVNRVGSSSGASVSKPKPVKDDDSDVPF